MQPLRRCASAVFALLLLESVAGGCSVGDGSGSVLGTLDIPMCWSGNFNLNPDFFDAVPYLDAVTIRLQAGDDYTTFSDGLIILVDNVHEIRGDAPFSSSLLDKALKVTLPAGVTPAGTPVAPVVDPGLVHMTLYLQESCPTDNVAMSVLEAVSVDAQGNCNPAPTGPFALACTTPSASAAAALANTAVDASADAGAPAPLLEGGTVLPASAPVKHSTITFNALFDGNAFESNAAQRLTDATFDVYLGDPRDACPGGVGPPPPCRGHLTGSFKFYFERGRPGQPFP